MSSLTEKVREGDIPPPPMKIANTTYSITVTYENDTKVYSRVRTVNMNPGLMVLKWSDREVLVPITTAVRDIEITEEAILS
jgi:hypothetical protein